MKTSSRQLQEERPFLHRATQHCSSHWPKQWQRFVHTDWTNEQMDSTSVAPAAGDCLVSWEHIERLETASCLHLKACESHTLYSREMCQLGNAHTLGSEDIFGLTRRRTDLGFQHVKGYGLQTTRRHQLRGLVVCFRQRKATGARTGYGCTSSSSETQSGSRIGVLMRTPNLGPSSSSGSWSSCTSGLHSAPSPRPVRLLLVSTSSSSSSCSSWPPPGSASWPGGSFL